MRILLIRHAEPDYGGDRLTEKGKREAALLAERICRYDIRDFYVSPLGRAVETAGHTLKRMGREAETLPWLQEFRGRMPDEKTGKLRVAWDLPPRVWTAEPDFMDPDAWAQARVYEGTNVREIWEETKAGVDQLMGRYGFRKDGPVWLGDTNNTDTIAMFCHFVISMMIAGYLMDLSPIMMTHRFLCLPSSVTELVTEERIPGEVAFRMTKLGDMTHLEAGGEPRSVAGQYPECYTGVDSTDQRINGNHVPLP